jgi:hypothetical protein
LKVGKENLTATLMKMLYICFRKEKKILFIYVRRRISRSVSTSIKKNYGALGAIVFDQPDLAIWFIRPRI